MRPLTIAAGAGLAWLALQPWAHAADVPPPAPAALGIGPRFDTDAAMPEHADPVASYTLHATLDVDKHEVEGRGTIAWRNASAVPEREVWVHLYLNGFQNERTVFMRFPGADSFRGGGAPSAWGGITVKRFAIHDGADLWPSRDKTSPGELDDETDIRVPLSEAVPPGATVTFDVEFTYALPSLLFRTGYVGGFHMVAQWFPKLARLEPDGHWEHFAFHHLSEFYADFGTYDVTVDTPSGVLVGATGVPSGEARLQDRIARRFVQEDVHDFAFAAWSKFEELTALSEGGIAIHLLYPPGYERDATVELDTVRFGLSHLGRAYGRYPYRTLTVVHPPVGAEEGGGMEYPTLITTGGWWFAPYTGVRGVDLVTIHELGHQWFYGMVATDEHRWPFLDEGLNSFAERDAMETRFPGSSGARALGISLGIDAWNRAAAAETERNAPVAQAATDFASGRDYGSLVYGRTATILATLANVYGAGPMGRALGRYTRRYRFQHPGPDDLLQAVREVVGDDAAEQLHAALFDRATVDYTVAEILLPTGAGDARPGMALVRRRGALRFPVDVDLIGEDRSVERVRWDAKESAAWLPYHGATRLVAAVVDPEHRVLLDDDLSNNARRASPSRVSGGLLDRFAFAAEALLSGILP